MLSFLDWLSRSPKDSSENSAAAIPRVLRTKDHIVAANVEGTSPTQEIELDPTWLTFRSTDEFEHESYAELTIANREPFTVAYSLGVRNNVIRCDKGYGILLPFQQKTVNIYICCAEDWEHSIDETISMNHKLLVENLRIPENVRPANDAAANEMAREIFSRTKRFNPMIRMYTKAIVILEKQLAD